MEFRLDPPGEYTDRARGPVVSVLELGQAFLRTLGGGNSPIDPCANSYQFAKKYALVLDRVSIADGLDGAYKHLKPVYEDTHRKKVMMAGAQSGKTASLMVGMTRDAFGPAYGLLMGYYFPDIHLPRAFSRGRYRPFLKSCPEIGRLVGASTKLVEGEVKGADALLTMSLAETMLYIMTIGGKTATEGLPLKAVYFDEVRRMNQSDIELAQERYSAQTEPIDVKVSTAKYPGADIDGFFQESDQRYFHTGCDCADGVVLSLTFPSCVADLRKASPELMRKVHHAYGLAGLTFETNAEHPPAAFICPTCGKIIADPRDGYWEPHNPQAFVHGYQMPQMLNPAQSAGSMLHAFEHTDDMQEFYNSKVGIPYVDRDKMPLQPENVDACVDDTLTWAAHLTHPQRKRRITNTAMGIDVQAGYGLAVIKQLAPSGKHRTIHMEVLRPPSATETWWYRAGQLMHEFDVRIAVVDEAPEYSESGAFAAAFNGRAYTANLNLGPNSPRVVQWDDQLRGDDKQRGETAIRYHVSMQRTKAIRWAVMRWKNRRNEIPDLRRLIQVLPQQKGEVVFSAHLKLGVESPAPIGLVFRDQICGFIFRDILEDDDDNERRIANQRQGKTKQIAEHIGRANDLAIADLFASVGLDRLGKPFGVRGLGE